MDNSVKQASVEEGKALANLYAGAGDLKATDKQVHDRLLQDAIKSHHCQLDIDLLRHSLVDEAGKRNDKSVTITEDQYGQVRRDNKSLPFLDILDGNKLYDPIEAYKAMQDDDRKTSEAAARKNPQTQLNLSDGTMGLATLFHTMTEATNQKK